MHKKLSHVAPESRAWCYFYHTLPSLAVKVTNEPRATLRQPAPMLQRIKEVYSKSRLPHDRW